MHIMHVIDSLAIGGAERMLVDIANQTAIGGHQVSVCVTRSACELAGELHPKINLLVLHRRVRFDGKAMFRLSRYVRQNRVELFHVHGRSTFALLAFMKLLRLVSVPIILHDHYGIEMDDSIPPWFRVLAKRVLAHYVGVYKKLSQWARLAGIPSEKISVVGNALDLTRLEVDDLHRREEYTYCRTEDMGPIGIMVAGLRREKGVDTLIEAVSLVKNPAPWKIIVVGRVHDTTYMQTCLERCAALKVEERVVFLGERPDAPALLRAVDFAVLPSRCESGPLVLIEYMTAGLPFVATRVGDVSLKVERFGLPGFVEPEDPAAFAKALERLLAIETRGREERGRAGREIAHRHFDIRHVIPQWYKTYHHVLGTV